MVAQNKLLDTPAPPLVATGDRFMIQNNLSPFFPFTYFFFDNVES